MATKRRLRCACCGEDAGTWEQFWNQDTGWGLCGRCADWIVDPPGTRWAMTREDLVKCYGKPGVHRAPGATTGA